MFWGCAKIPPQYVRMAEPGVTLTELNAHPETYRGKVVLLGGTMIEEGENEQHHWLRLKNRPLDQDYVPHRPVDMDGPEAGSYWVMVPKQQLPPSYRHWTRMTVVGRVTGTLRFKTEPVLYLIYVRGWGASTAHDGVWAHVDPNYYPSIPEGVQGELGAGAP
jgi:starvation-inducible outer membrane lipoprotein